MNKEKSQWELRRNEGCTGGSTQRERDGGKGVGRRKKKVCAVRYADEGVMASMQEWTQSVPQDQQEHTHRVAH